MSDTGFDLVAAARREMIAEGFHSDFPAHLIRDIAERSVRLGVSPAAATADSPAEREFVRQHSGSIWHAIANLRNSSKTEPEPAKLKVSPKSEPTDDVEDDLAATTPDRDRDTDDECMCQCESCRSGSCSGCDDLDCDDPNCIHGLSSDDDYRLTP